MKIYFIQSKLISDFTSKFFNNRDNILREIYNTGYTKYLSCVNKIVLKMMLTNNIITKKEFISYKRINKFLNNELIKKEILKILPTFFNSFVTEIIYTNFSGVNNNIFYIDIIYKMIHEYTSCSIAVEFDTIKILNIMNKYNFISDSDFFIQSL